MEFLIILFITLGVLYVIGLVFLRLLKLIGRLVGFKGNNSSTEANPYIKAHRSKFKNDADYEQYLQWLSKKGGDIPIEKKMSDEERKFFRELNKK